jgi:hypothetical protein
MCAQWNWPKGNISIIHQQSLTTHQTHYSICSSSNSSPSLPLLACKPSTVPPSVHLSLSPLLPSSPLLRLCRDSLMLLRSTSLNTALERTLSLLVSPEPSPPRDPHSRFRDTLRIRKLSRQLELKRLLSSVSTTLPSVSLFKIIHVSYSSAKNRTVDLVSMLLSACVMFI